MLEEEKISRDDILETLYCMGYFGHCKEEDARIEKLNHSELYAYYEEKSLQMDEEDENGF